MSAHHVLLTFPKECRWCFFLEPVEGKHHIKFKLDAPATYDGTFVTDEVLSMPADDIGNKADALRRSER